MLLNSLSGKDQGAFSAGSLNTVVHSVYAGASWLRVFDLANVSASGAPSISLVAVQVGDILYLAS